MGDNKKSSISRRSTCYLLNLKQPTQTAKRLKLSFQRTAATVTIPKSDRTVEASVGLLDVSETGAGVFTPELLNKGSTVELCITEPVVLKVRGIVAWSAPVHSGVHQGKFKCRSGIQFVFEGDSQLASVKEFVKRAHSDPIENMRAGSAIQEVPPVSNADVPVAPVASAAEATPAVTEPPVVAPVAEAAPAATTAPTDSPVTPVSVVPPTDGNGTPDSGQQAA